MKSWSRRDCAHSPHRWGALVGVAMALGLIIGPANSQEQADVAPACVMEWVDVAKADAGQVSAAIARLAEAFSYEDEGAPFFMMRLGEKVAVYGPERLRKIAVELLKSIPAPSPVDEQTVVVGLSPTAGPDQLEQLDKVPGLASMEQVGGAVILRGASRASDATVKLLTAAGLVHDPNAPWCETVRLYYLRRPNIVQGIISNMPPEIIQNVSVLGGEDPSGPPTLVLAGPRSQVDDVKRVIAALDVPHPEVRLDIWAFQLSGGNAAEVAKRAQLAQSHVAAIARLVRGYLRQLDAYAQQKLVENEELVAAAEQERLEAADLVADIESTTKIAAATCQQVAQLGSSFVLTPSARGRHPLSLTETLATLITVPPDSETDQDDDAAAKKSKDQPDFTVLVGVAQTPAAETRNSRMLTISAGLNEMLGGWLAELQQSDPEALETWHALAKRDGSGSSEEFTELLDSALRATRRDERRARGRVHDARPLLPRRLLETFRDEDYALTAQESIGAFLSMHARLADDWSAAPPEHLRMRAADAQVVLQNAERALGEDVQKLFLRPLQNELQALAGAGGQSGLGSASTTSIAVLSGTEAEVIGSAVSYFDVSQSKQLDIGALHRSEEFSDALSGFLPRRARRSAPRVVVRVTVDPASVSGDDLDAWTTRLQQVLPGVQCWPLQGAGGTGLMLVGTNQEVASAASILQTGGIISRVQLAGAMNEATPMAATVGPGPEIISDATDLAGLGADRLFALALDLGQEEEIWTALTEGAKLTFTPHVLPGGSAAELAINFEVTHNDPGSGGVAPMNAPLSRVAKHSARTSVYVQALDLFSLSSLTLGTTHPRPDKVVPILGQIPFLGRMFQFPRKPATVYHESVLMVYSTILPTGADLAATLDVANAGREER